MIVSFLTLNNWNIENLKTWVLISRGLKLILGTQEYESYLALKILPNCDSVNYTLGHRSHWYLHCFPSRGDVVSIYVIIAKLSLSPSLDEKYKAGWIWLANITMENRDRPDQIWRIDTETRLKISESQWQDQDQDWKCLSHNDETDIEVLWVSMMRLRLRLTLKVSMTRLRSKISESHLRDWHQV